MEGIGGHSAERAWGEHWVHVDKAREESIKYHVYVYSVLHVYIHVYVC